GTPHRPLRIITAGNVIPRKNLHLLIPAVLQSPGMTLDIYGDDAVDPDYTARLRRLADGASEDRMPEGRRMEGNAGSEDRRIRFHGRVPNEALDRGFAEADLFAMPSSYEGFGIVYLEALEAGVPVLATVRGGASEIVTDRDVGVLVQPTRRGITKGLREIAARIRREGDPAAGTGWYHHEKGAGSGAATVSAGRLPGDACRRRAASFYGWTRTMEGAAWFLEEVSNGRGAPDQTAPGRSTTALGHRSRDTTRRGPFSAAGA
ncbi:MAG: glycosyltransferase, partial [Alkalispirochaeta sp.]